MKTTALELHWKVNTLKHSQNDTFFESVTIYPFVYTLCATWWVGLQSGSYSNGSCWEILSRRMVHTMNFIEFNEYYS